MNRFTLFLCLAVAGGATAQESLPSYKMIRLAGADVPSFEGWETKHLGGGSEFIDLVAFPRKAESHAFAVRVILISPESPRMRNFSVEAAGYVARLLHAFQRVQEAKQVRLADGRRALAEEFRGAVNGVEVRVRAVYFLKDRAGMILLGMGAAEGFRRYGPAMGIFLTKTSRVSEGAFPRRERAGSISPNLVGTWVWEMSSGAGINSQALVSSKVSVTLYANGTYVYDGITITSHSDSAPSRTRDSGTVTQQGNVLIFTSRSGVTQRIQIRMKGDGLLYAGNRAFIKQ